MIVFFVNKQNFVDFILKVAWLDKIDRRYSWLKRILIQFEEEFVGTFPPDWDVEERMCLEFCNITK